MRALIAALLLLTGPSLLAANPDAVILGAMEELQAEMNQRKETLQAEPAQLRGVVDRILLPRFDTDFAAQRVLGKYWRTASEKQRRRFVDVFYRYLVNNYATYLLDFRGDEVQVSSSADRPMEKYPLVRTTVILNQGEAAAVDYVMRDVGGQWKVIDVIIEGISYVRSYREDFSPEIAKSGLDALIARLEKATPELGGKGE